MRKKIKTEVVRLERDGSITRKKVWRKRQTNENYDPDKSWQARSSFDRLEDEKKFGRARIMHHKENPEQKLFTKSMSRLMNSSSVKLPTDGRRCCCNHPK